MFRQMRTLANILLAALVLAALVVAPVSAQTGGVKVVAPNVAVAHVGDPITVEINLDIDQPVAGAAFTLNWDPAIMTCSAWNQTGSVLEAAGYSGGLFVVDTPLFTFPGRTSFGVAGMGTPANGHPDDEVGLLVRFTCVAIRQDALTSLNLSNVTLSDPNGNLYPTATGVDGQVIVGTAPGVNYVIQDLVASPIAGELNQFDLAFKVVNIGNAPALVPSEAVVAVNSTPLLPGQVTPALVENGGAFSVALAAVDFTGASAQICVTADAGLVVGETNEGDNTTCVNFSSTSDTDTTEISCTQPRVLELTAPSDISDCQFHIGWNSCTRPMNVKCNTDWNVEVSDQSTTTVGHLTEWNGANYLTRKLLAPLHVEAQGHDVEMPGPGLLAQGDIALQSYNDGQNVDVYFGQEIYVQDEVLPSGSAYRIVVTFLAYVTF